jgi:hypothetical protein
MVPLLLIASGAACANELAGADIEIVSVLSRNPDVKPIGMSVPADGRHEPANLANLSRDSASDSGTAKVVSAESPKPAPSTRGNTR